MNQRLGKYLSVLLLAAGAVGATWLAVRFLLPWAAPFIVAYALAACMEWPVRFLVRRGWRRTAASGVITLAVLTAIIWAAVMLTLKGISAATAFAKEVPDLMAAVSESLSALENRAFQYAETRPDGVEAYLKTAISAIGEVMNSLPALISKGALTLLSKTAQASPDTLIFIVTAGIGAYFLSAAFPRTNAFILAQLPENIKRHMSGLGQSLKGSFGGFFKSQLILMAMTFFELLISFLLLNIEGAVGLAALTAIIDALPVFGTGAVLIPWALCCLLLGYGRRGIGLLASWVVVNLVRNCAQAKLLGDQIGLNPIASLLAIYVGWRVCGVLGMLAFPILLVTIQQLNESGVIKLWKNID